MKKIIGIFVTVIALGFAGVAQAGFMESSFGNTVTVTTGEGVLQASFMFNEDGSFTFAQGDGQTMEGTWTIDGNNLCFTLGENSECHEVEDLGVGESWTDTNEDGSTSTISIVAGR